MKAPWKTVATRDSDGGEYAEVSGVVTYNYEVCANCYNTGDCGLDDACIGGVVGYNYEGMVQNCYNTGNLTGGQM